VPRDYRSLERGAGTQEGQAMTLPHLSNCQHNLDGWCLSCVADLQSRISDLEAEKEELHLLRIDNESTIRVLYSKLRDIETNFVLTRKA
jgi:hypothetical protein